MLHIHFGLLTRKTINKERKFQILRGRISGYLVKSDTAFGLNFFRVVNVGVVNVGLGVLQIISIF